MSDRSQWKMLHLLYRFGKPSLSHQQLSDAGIDCYGDTIIPFLNAGVVVEHNGTFALGEATTAIMSATLIANRRWPGTDLRVDYPEAFVAMPFAEPWSNDVYAHLIEPAVSGAGLKSVRGDAIVRAGDLGQNIWDAILRAGIIVADVSVSNPNVFYEIGLAHALGKDLFMLKQKDSRLPSDVGGAHYYEYSLAAIDIARDVLQRELAAWAGSRGVMAAGVKALE